MKFDMHAKVSRNEQASNETPRNVALSEHRARVTDPWLPHDVPREDLHGQTAFEAALYGAAGDDMGDGMFHYSIENGREDLAALIGDRTDLGAMMTSGRVSKPVSLVARALQAQDGTSVEMLLKAGATLAEGENPVKILVNGTSNAAWSYSTDHDQIGIEQSLKALKAAGHDLNAPIDGRPPAFHMVETMVSQAVAHEEIMGAGDTSNLYQTFQAAAENGVDFRARDSEGRTVAQSLDQSLAAEGRALSAQDPLRKALEAAAMVSKEQSIQALAQQRASSSQLQTSKTRGRGDNQR